MLLMRFLLADFNDLRSGQSQVGDQDYRLWPNCLPRDERLSGSGFLE